MSVINTQGQAQDDESGLVRAEWTREEGRAVKRAGLQARTIMQQYFGLHVVGRAFSTPPSPAVLHLRGQALLGQWLCSIAHQMPAGTTKMK